MDSSPSKIFVYASACAAYGTIACKCIASKNKQTLFLEYFIALTKITPPNTSSYGTILQRYGASGAEPTVIGSPLTI
jgi:hypothetical protein